MLFFKKKKCNSLPEAIQNASGCKELSLKWLDYNLKTHGRDFAMLKKLRSLYIQGNPTIYDMPGFELPEELGELKTLKTLSLLNLPLQEFPGWITQLTGLEHLMVRGTDIQVIPESIAALKNLIILRIENCPLPALPVELKHLKKLRILGLSDTRLTSIHPEGMPDGLKEINLTGTGIYDWEELKKLRVVLKHAAIRPWDP